MKQILVVDDSIIMQAMYTQTFNRRPEFAVKFANNGAEGIQIIARDGEPDLIFLDINMPLVDGHAFLGHAASVGLDKRVPIVVVTTEGSEEAIQRAMKEGASGYVCKPFRPNDIYAVVDRLLNSKKGTDTRQDIAPPSKSPSNP